MAIIISMGKPKEKPKPLVEQLKLGKTNVLKDVLSNSNKQPMSLNLGQTPEPVQEAVKTNPIPAITDTKYALLVDATDTLKEDVLEQFNTRMQFLEMSFDNEDLPSAMQRVLEYCQDNQELRPFLRVSDISLFVKGARSSYARVAEVKTKNRKSKSKSVALNDDILEALADIEIDL